MEVVDHEDTHFLLTCACGHTHLAQPVRLGGEDRQFGSFRRLLDDMKVKLSATYEDVPQILWIGQMDAGAALGEVRCQFARESSLSGALFAVHQEHGCALALIHRLKGASEYQG